MNAIQFASEFERRVEAFYDEASRYGVHRAFLRGGSVIAEVRDCRPALEDRWAELAELLGGDADLQLRLAVVAIRRLVAMDRAVLYEQSVPEAMMLRHVLQVAEGVDLLA